MRLGFGLLAFGVTLLSAAPAFADDDAGPDAAVAPIDTPEDDDGINLAGGANDDNKCAVRGIGATASAFGAAALALGLVSLVRRRRD